jgi:hypothetical protein
MHANAPHPRNQKWHDRLVRSGFFLGAVLLHLILFLMVATLVIWRAPAPPPLEEFHLVSIQVPPPPPAPPPASSAAAANPQMEPQPEVVPVATPVSVISNFNNNFTVDTSKVLNQALDHMNQKVPEGTGLATGTNGSLGSLSGSGGGYGQAGTGTGFVGTLYDLKQTPDQKPTDIAETEEELSKGTDRHWQKSSATVNGLKVLRSFVKTWDLRLLDQYYKAPNPLHATQICIPLTPSKNAPIAFHVEGTVHPRRWNVVYHAKVVPPDSGEFRFIGFADDFLVVRVDGQNVLDATYGGEELDIDANVKEDVGIGPEKQPLKCGKWIRMEVGTPLDMWVLIGEGPGGSSGFLLMIQKRDDNSPVGDYPVFQLQQTPVPDLDPTFRFSKKTMVFQVSQ